MVVKAAITLLLLSVALPASAQDPLSGFLDRFRTAPPPSHYFRGWTPDIEHIEPVDGTVLRDVLFGNAIRGSGRVASRESRGHYLEVYRPDGSLDYYATWGRQTGQARLTGGRICYDYNGGSEHCHLTFRYGRCYIDYQIDSPLDGDKPANPDNWHSIWAPTDDPDWSSDIDVTEDFLLCDASLA